MEKYGQIIDPSFDPHKNDIYQLFAEYFDNPSMTKLKDVDGMSIYITKIHCLLNNMYRYLMVFTEKDNYPLQKTEFLSNLNWIYLHTRTLEEKYNLKSHSYQPRRFQPLMKPIKQYKKDDDGYYYNVDGMPLEIILLSVKHTQNEYSPTGVIATALETYNTIVSWR